MLALVLQTAQACQPLSAKYWEDTPRRVKANFDGAQFVVVATVVDVRTVRQSGSEFPDFKMDLERATFRVDRAYKGALRPGATFHIDSGWSSCGRGVKNMDAVPFADGKKVTAQPAYPKRWIVYYTPPDNRPYSPVQLPPFEITSSPLSRPLEQASYDLTILEKIGGR